MIELQEYTTPDGHSPFADWFNDLDAAIAAKITTALVRVELGNFSNANFPMRKELALAYWNIALISALVTGFILAKTANDWSFCWRVAPKSANSSTLKPHKFDGKITNNANDSEIKNDPNS